MLAMAQGWPASYGGVMLQGFFWDSYKETPDCSPWGPWQYHQVNSATQSHRPGYTWATMYGAGWGAAEEWQVPVTTWSSLLAHKNEITPFIDLIWLPQSGSTVADSTQVYSAENDNSGRGGVRPWRNGGTWAFDGNTITNPDCMGFVPVFYFHHGLTYNADGTPWTYTDQSGHVWTPKSYFGTEAELRQLISEYKAAGTGAVEDVVANHRGGLGTWSGDKNSIEFPSEYYKGELISWTSADVCSDDESGRGTGQSDCGGKGEWARDLDHHSPATRAKVIKFLDYLKNDLGYVGFRYDYAMGFEESHFAEYNIALRPTFSVGEYWGEQSNIANWIKQTYKDGAIQSGAFDFPLQAKIKEAFNFGNYRCLNNVGLISDYRMKRYAVTFIDNHDTFKDLPTDGSNYNWDTHQGYNHRVTNHIEEANAFILAMPGTPCLFYPHFMHPDWHDNICKMILARRAAGVTNEAAVWAAEMIGTNGIQWLITGTKGEVFLQLGEEAVNTGIPAGFSEVFKTDVCRYSITTSCYNTVDWSNLAANQKPTLINGYAVVDKQSGSYSGSLSVSVKPSSAGCVLVYSTNGVDPTPASKRITDENGIVLNITETTDLRVGVLVDNKVMPGSVVRNTYVIDTAQPSSSHKVYIYVPESWSGNPYIYAWNDDGNLTDAFPGWPLQGGAGYEKNIGGITWREATIPASNFNMILSYGNDASKTANISDIDHDVFYSYKDGVAYDVTATYVKALHNPLVAIDKASGRYTGNLTVEFTSTVEDAIIVYTIGDVNNPAEPPTATSAQIASGQTITFNTDGTHQLRAAILKSDGTVINEVARTYFLENAGQGTTSYVPSEVVTSGINLYIHTSDGEAPYIHAWNAKYHGSTVSIGQSPFKVDVKKRTTSDDKVWYYYHIDADVLNFLVCKDESFTNQTENKYIDSEGCFFYDYNNGAISEATSTYAPWTTDLPTTGANILVKVIGNYNYGPKIHVWNSADGNTSWSGVQMTETKSIGGVTWYYKHFNTSNMDFLLNYNGDSDKTADINIVRGANGTSYFIEYNPSSKSYSNVSSNYNAWHQSFNFSQEDVIDNEPIVATGGLPSCATYVPDAQYIYFENDKPYSVPFTWIWNGTSVFSGTCWPGEALVDMVGISPQGNAIYRWTYTGEGTPADVIFNDNGGNEPGNTQTGTMEFVNGGYYTASGGCIGTVNENVTSLAGLIKSGDTSKEFIISNNLDYVFSTDNAIWAKDKDGDAVDASAMGPNQSYYIGTETYNSLRNGDFDQSNWVKLILPGNDYVTPSTYDHQLLGQTIIGRLVDADNPTVELTVEPIFSSKRVGYVPNTYIPSNFVEQPQYFFVTPKPQEYCNVVWACYRGQENGKHVFTVPDKQQRDNGAWINKEDLPGALIVEVGDLLNRPSYSFVPGELYELTGIIEKLPGSAAGSPRHVMAQDGTPSANYALNLVSYQGEGNLVITAVEDVTDVVSREVADVKYVNMAGMVSNRPFDGVNIVVTRYTDGSTSTMKILK